MTTDRQSHSRCVHPTLGPGVLTSENGSASFRADSGEVVPVARIVGWGSSGTHVNIEGRAVTLVTKGLQVGDHHKRAWSPVFGPGWFVLLAGLPWRDGMTPVEEARTNASRGKARFDPDDGEPVSWQWSRAWVGRLEGKEPRSKSGKAEWDRWMTYGAFEFRDEAPTPSTGAVVAEPTRQLTLGAAK